jgi:hypothetical protein
LPSATAAALPYWKRRQESLRFVCLLLCLLHRGWKVVGCMKVTSMPTTEHYGSLKAGFFADREDFGRRMESIE